MITLHSLVWIAAVVILLASLASMPRWHYAADWGPYPSGALGIVFILILLMLLTGRI